MTDLLPLIELALSLVAYALFSVQMRIWDEQHRVES